MFTNVGALPSSTPSSSPARHNHHLHHHQKFKKTITSQHRHHPYHQTTTSKRNTNITTSITHHPYIRQHNISSLINHHVSNYQQPLSASSYASPASITPCMTTIITIRSVSIAGITILNSSPGIAIMVARPSPPKASAPRNHNHKNIISKNKNDIHANDINNGKEN